MYDPFCGSASTSIASTHFGAFSFGSDLDKRVILGTSVGRASYDEQIVNQVKAEAKEGSEDRDGKFSIFTNFRHYKLPLPDVFAQDVTKP